MSSLRQLNNQIKLKRVESKLSIRECELNLKQLLFSVDKKVNKNPVETMLVVMVASLFANKYKKRTKTIYSLFSFSRDHYLQYARKNKTK
ncbi:hypothetical protein ACLKMH_02910 [Psychromonas sp. KJ10-10]|uniref:hypothetical protein n=1 Tax=Psychromonas sp. KJ10-10 TaxID=3391823 RepID=UPI0039B40B44